MSTKKISKVTSHLSDELHTYIEKMSGLQGISPSEFIRQLSQADYEEKEAFVDSLAPLFGYEKRGESAERAKEKTAAFSRVINFPLKTGTNS